MILNITATIGNECREPAFAATRRLPTHSIEEIAP